MSTDTNTTREAIQGEITALKSLLADSDFSIIKALEGIVNCTSATGIITFLKDLTSDVKEIVERRTVWRTNLNALEEQLASINNPATVPADTSDEPTT